MESKGSVSTERSLRTVIPERLVRGKVRIWGGMDFLQERNRGALGLKEGSEPVKARVLPALAAPKAVGVEEGKSESVPLGGRRANYRPSPRSFPCSRRRAHRLA